MLNRWLLIISVFFLFVNIQAQTVTVLDKTTGAPIRNVAVFSHETTFSTLTDKAGTFELDGNTGKVVVFQHTGYYPKELSVSQIKKKEYLIFLTPRVIQLNQFVISANKWEQPKEDVPAKITTISKDQIRTYNPQTAADILAQSHEVFIQKSQMAGGSPMIRGFSTNSVLLVVDGIRLNNAIYRTGNVQNAINIDPNILEGTEIVFGPGSVIYGSDALGGVMDFHITKPEYSSSDEILCTGNAMMRYNSANNEKSAHADISLAGKKITSFTSISFSDYDHLQMGFNGNDNEQYLRSWYVQRIDEKDSIVANEDPNTQIESAFSQYHLTQKLNWKPKDNMELSYLFYYSGTSDLPRYDQLRVLSNGDPKFAEWYYGPQNLMINSVTADFSKPNKIYNNAKITTSLQQYKESRNYRKFNKLTRVMQNENVGIATVNADFEKTIKAGTGLVYGVEFLYNNLHSEADEMNIVDGTLSEDFVLPRYPDGKNHWYSAAAYTGFRHSFKNIILNTGIRYSFVGIKSTFNNEFYINTFGYDELINKNGALNGSLGMTYKLNKNTILYLNGSSGFHAPNWDGLAKVFTPKKGVVIVPNSELQPEYAYNGEVGITRHLFNDHATIEANVYYTYLDNAIVQREFSLNGETQMVIDGDTNNIEAFINASYAHLYGFNLSFQADINRKLGIKSHLSYTHGRDAENAPLRHVAPLFGGSHIIFKHKTITADFYAIYNGAITADNLAPSEYGKDYMYAYDENGELWAPSWYTLNFNLGWKLSDLFFVHGNIENILDARYRPYGSGICAPGRSISVNISIHF